MELEILSETMFDGSKKAKQLFRSDIRVQNPLDVCDILFESWEERNEKQRKYS